MARKGGRGSGSRRGGSSNGHVASRKSVTQDDISDDEIDSFHDQRDKILLDGAQEQNTDRFDALGTGRGVLEVDEADDSSDDEDDEDEEEEDDDDDDDEEDEVSLLPSRSNAASSKKAATSTIQDDSSDDDDEHPADEDDIIGGWGPNKRAYYNTNDLDALESDSEMDEDEKRAMELDEVRKLQKRNRQGMTDADFGLGDEEAGTQANGAAARMQRKKDLDATSAHHDAAKAAAAALPHNPAELIAKIQRDTPETIALIGEFADVVQEIDTVTARIQALKGSQNMSLGLLHLHHQTLLTYVTTLTFYFYMRASPSFADGTSRIKQHAIIERLARLKQGLSALENFGLAADEEDSVEEELDEEDEVSDEETQVSFLYKPAFPLQDDGSEDGGESMGSLEDDELMQLDAEEKENDRRAVAQVSVKANGDAKKKKQDKGKGKQKASDAPSGKPTKSKKEVAPLADALNDDGGDEDAENAPPTKRRKATSSSRFAADSDAAYDAMGEPTALSTVDMADKEATRRSLKFHTGQIDARGSRAGRRQLDGDQDIPYRDKERSRMAVAAANQSKSIKANGMAGARQQLDGDDFGAQDARDWRDVMNIDNDLGEGGEGGGGGRSTDADGYYDLVTSARKAAKKEQKEQHDEERMAQRVAPAGAMEDGEHRAINREIEKNRGLTPRRPKSVRNPRVKKRMRYEAAQKKLSSRGPVYKGGEAALQGGYGGETSGISSHVVKSRQFSN